MSTPPRRSGRTRKTNAKYSNNDWNKEALRLLRESSESSNPTSVESEAEPEVNLEQSDAEFDEQQSHESPEDDNISVASASSKSSHVVIPRGNVDDNAEDDTSIVDSDEDNSGILRPVTQKQPAQTHSRGIQHIQRGRSARSDIWQCIFGPEIDDLQPVLEARDRWLLNSRDVTLPSFMTIQQARHGEWTRLDGHRSDGQDDNRLNLDESSQQESSIVSQQEVQARCFVVHSHDHDIVLGPFSHQNLYDMPLSKPINLGKAWKKDKSLRDSPTYHSGWLLNVGEKVQCMAWARHKSRHQYLALTCRSTPQQRQSVPEPDSQTSPAFRPSSSYPINIQIWRFTTLSEKSQSTMDVKSPPQLAAIIAYNSGDVKQMAWAPTDSRDSRAETEGYIGSLTTLSTDGGLRLFQIPKSATSSSEPPSHIQVTRSAIEIASPSDSIFTCFVFASPSDLILGTSSGHVYAYNISQPTSKIDSLKPYLIHQLHHTYIMSICTTGNDKHPEFIVTASAAGTIKLTNLCSPSQDTVSVHRTRLPSRNLLVNTHTRAILTSVDSSGNTEPRGSAQSTLVAHHFRHFYASTALSKFPEGDGTTTVMAGSSLHPYILVGNTGGSVWSQNVIRRILPTGKTGSISEGGSWVQKIVDYRWIPHPSTNHPHDSTTTSSSTANKRRDPSKLDLYHGTPVRPGRSRMYHGFRPEKLDLSNSGSKNRKSAARGPDGENAIQVTFEDEQAVSAIVWNENLVAASWCAIAWASGVVWITDLGHETV